MQTYESTEWSVRRTAPMIDATKIALRPGPQWNEYRTGVYIKQRPALARFHVALYAHKHRPNTAEYVATE